MNLPAGGSQSSSTPTSPFTKAIGSSRVSGGGTSPGFGRSSNNSVMKDALITILPSNAIKTLVATKASRGEWHHEKGKSIWKIPTTGGGGNFGMIATFRTGIVLKASADDEEEEEDEDEEDAVAAEYDDGFNIPTEKPSNKRKEELAEARLQRKKPGWQQ